MKHLTTLAIGTALVFSFLPDGAHAKNGKKCPPGLAKKSPSCVPPGLAKKGVTAEEWANRGEDPEVGDELEPTDYLTLREGDRVTIDGVEYVVVDTDNGTVLKRGDDWYRLPTEDGSYVRVGDALIRVDPKTRAVLDIIELTDLILG